MKRTLQLLAVLVALMIIISGCSSQPKLPNTDGAVGYRLVSDSMQCTAAANGEIKYTHFISYASGMEIQFYVSKTEIIAIYSNGGVKSYYKEPLESGMISLSNPLQNIQTALSKLTFSNDGTSELHGESYDVLLSVETERYEAAAEIEYTKYFIELDFIDGKHYTFRYYDCSDGSTLISVEAPKEINPEFTPDTPWIIDTQNNLLRNTATDESIAFTVTKTETGTDISPDPTNTVTETIEKCTRLYADEDNKLRYIQYDKGTPIEILYDFTFVPPEITEDMREMTYDGFQTVQMIISTVESILE